VPNELAARLEVLAAALLFSTGGAAIKAATLTGWQVASLRSGVACLVVLAILSWQLTLAVMTILPPLIIATIWFRRVSSRAYTRAREAISTVNAEFQENISGVRVAQAYVREDANIDSFRNTTDVYKNARVTTQRIQSFYFPLIMFLSTCADAIVFGYGGTLVQEGVITSATVLTFVLFLDQFFAPIQQLVQLYTTFQSGQAAVRKLREALTAGDKTQLDAAFKSTVSVLDKSVQKGVLHKNTASRYKSRLAARVKAAATA